MQRWAIIILLILASNVAAGELPSEVDLRAAYCLLVLQDVIGQFQSLEKDIEDAADKAANAAMLSSSRANLRRLQLYLVPRMEHLDLIGLAVAKKRGQEDVVKVSQLFDTCQAQCSPPRTKPSEWRSCLDKCHDNPLLTRIQGCSKLSWLPF